MIKKYLFLGAVIILLFISACDYRITKDGDSVDNGNDYSEHTSNGAQVPIKKKVEIEKVNCIQSKEICDGVDNDCDGEIDEGNSLCTSNKICVNGKCIYCSPSLGPTPEICDGVDNDCDGEIDEGVRNRCGDCAPEPLEYCDGVDNDCDGEIDERENNVCNNYQCPARSVYEGNFDFCTFNDGKDGEVETGWVCINKRCEPLAVCNIEEKCFYDWAGEFGGLGIENAKEIRLWGGPKRDDGEVHYFCGEYDSNNEITFDSCVGSGCSVMKCQGGRNCARICYAFKGDNIRQPSNRVQCEHYVGINNICKFVN